MRYVDRTMETTLTTGTGALALTGAVQGYQAFDAALTTGDEVAYCVAAGTQWEVGVGVFTAPGTLTRVTVRASSNSNALVSFAAGEKRVFVTLAAADVVDRQRLAPVANLAALAAYDTASLAPGAVLRVATLEADFAFLPGVEVTADGITIIEASGGVFAREEGYSARWRKQPEWHIDFENGDDEAIGDDVTRALRTQPEWARRVGPEPSVAQRVYLRNASPENAATMNMDWRAANSFETRILVIGERSAAVFEGTLTDVQNWNSNTLEDGRATVPEVPTEITAAGLIGALCVHEATGYTFWGARDLGSKRMRFSYLVEGGPDNWTFALGDVAEGDAFTAHTITHLPGRHRWFGQGYIQFYDIHFGVEGAGAHQHECHGHAWFITCKLFGFDPGATSDVQLYGCWNSHTTGARVYGRAILWDFGSVFPYGAMVYGGTFRPDKTVCLGPVRLDPHTVLAPSGSFGVFDTEIGVDAFPMSRVDLWYGRLWGNGLTVGVRLDAGAGLIWYEDYPPVLDVSAGGESAVEFNVGGAVKAFADLPFVNPTTQAYAVAALY